jgi:hypothetical protein
MFHQIVNNEQRYRLPAKQLNGFDACVVVIANKI